MSAVPFDVFITNVDDAKDARYSATIVHIQERGTYIPSTFKLDYGSKFDDAPVVRLLNEYFQCANPFPEPLGDNKARAPSNGPEWDFKYEGIRGDLVHAWENMVESDKHTTGPSANHTVAITASTMSHAMCV